MSKSIQRVFVKAGAVALIALMVLFTYPGSISTAHADAGTVKNAVTVSVKKSDNTTPIVGATVNATFSGVPAPPASVSATTDEDGVASVLPEAEFEAGLKLEATVSAPGYFDGALAETEITSGIDNFDITLEAMDEAAYSLTPIAGLSYTGSAQTLVTHVVPDGTTVSYRVTQTPEGGGTPPDEVLPSQTGVPQLTDAGTYTVIMDVTTADGKHGTLQAEVTIAKATSTLSFTDTSYTAGGSSTVAFTAVSNPYDFKALEAVPGGVAPSGITPTYKITDGAEPSVAIPAGAATIAADGKLTVLQPGKIVVTASVAGNDNYAEQSISYTLTVTPEVGVALLSFPVAPAAGAPPAEYILGTNNGVISEAVASKAYLLDDGAVSYTITNSAEVPGVEIEASTGKVTVEDYAALIAAMEEAREADPTATLTVKITATKAASSDGVFPAYTESDSTAKYSVEIKFLDTPSNAESSFNLGGTSVEGWYTTAVPVTTTLSGYHLAFSVSDIATSFAATATVSGDGEEKYFVYMRNTTTGGITARVSIGTVRIDTQAPINLTMTYSEATREDIMSTGESYGFYGDAVRVTFTAEDAGSGVASFTWEYNRQAGASDTNVETLSGTLANTPTNPEIITLVDGKYTAQITIPNATADQLRGNLKIKAEDAAENESTFVTHSILGDGNTPSNNHVIVVDGVLPVFSNAGMTQPVRTVGNTSYYNGNFDMQFSVAEANFFSEDVVLSVSKDGGAPVRQTLSWSSNADIHQSAIKLTQDGSYVITIQYTDRSGNIMQSYTSHTIVVDTVAPALSAEYSQPSATISQERYYNSAPSITLQLEERNFYPEDLVLTIRRDGENVTAPSVSWSTSGDTHTGVITLPAGSDHSGDGRYFVHASYSDRSAHAATAFNSTPVIIDTITPQLSISYGNTNAVQSLTDGSGNMRDYFSASRTATLVIEELNFDPSEVEVLVTATNAAGEALPVQSLLQQGEWTSSGTTHSLPLTFAGDGNYTVDFRYLDKAQNSIDTFTKQYFTVDTAVPENLTVQYSTGVLNTSIGGSGYMFYNVPVTITITATDVTAGVHEFSYSYLRAPSVSGINAELLNRAIQSAEITYDGANATAKFTVPAGTLSAGSQFNGNIEFTAIDRSQNDSSKSESQRLVVDNIAPTATITYSDPVNTEEGISYYDGEVLATIEVTEANFYPEDMDVAVTNLDGGEQAVTPTWTTGTDTHTGTFTIAEDGDYTVRINYTDKSTNQMEEYTSEQLTVDTDLEPATITINGEEGDGIAFQDELVLGISFDDPNYDNYEVTLLRTRFDTVEQDVTEELLGQEILTTAEGGNGIYPDFEHIAENDGIYTLNVVLSDKAGHQEESSIVFTANRYGSVYVYNDALSALIAEGGQYVQAVSDSLHITEYNADRLLEDSLNIEITRDGRPIEAPAFEVSPTINDRVAVGSSGWYQYDYVIASENFAQSGVYNISVSSEDATGNTPDNSSMEGMGIRFVVDSLAPELSSVTGLETDIINATEVSVGYQIFDNLGLESISVYVDGQLHGASITDFGDDANNYQGSFTLSESNAAQSVRFVIVDLAGNITDTDEEGFASAFAFEHEVTVSTNIFVRWFANKPLFYGTLIGAVLLIGGAVTTVIFIRRKRMSV